MQCEYIPKARCYSRKNPSQTGDRGGGDMEFPRVLKSVEIPGLNLKRSGISTGVFTKNSFGMTRR